MRHVYLGYTKDTCQLAVMVSQEPAIAAIVNSVVCCNTDGCNAPVEPPPSTPAPVVTAYVVRLVLSLPLTRAQFNATVQLRFREQMAVAAGMGRGDAGRVDIVISDASGSRRLLAGLAINVSISMANASAAQTAAAGLTSTAINKALADVGLPPVRIAVTGSSPTVMGSPSRIPYSPLFAL
jgi:hypothetical protein